MSGGDDVGLALAQRLYKDGLVAPDGPRRIVLTEKGKKRLDSGHGGAEERKYLAALPYDLQLSPPIATAYDILGCAEC